TVIKMSRKEMLVPCTHQPVWGIAHKILAVEYRRATPLGPYSNPLKYPSITVAARTRAGFRLRCSNPDANITHASGSIVAITTKFGASKRKMGGAASHLGPINM